MRRTFSQRGSSQRASATASAGAAARSPSANRRRLILLQDIEVWTIRALRLLFREDNRWSPSVENPALSGANPLLERRVQFLPDCEMHLLSVTGQQAESFTVGWSVGYARVGAALA